MAELLLLTMEYFEARKFHNWTRCTGGILLWQHAVIHRLKSDEAYCMHRFLILTPAPTEMIGTPEFNNLDG